MYKVCEAYTYIETGLESILRMEDSPLLGEADPAVGSLQGEPSFLIAGKGNVPASSIIAPKTGSGLVGVCLVHAAAILLARQHAIYNMLLYGLKQPAERSAGGVFGCQMAQNGFPGSPFASSIRFSPPGPDLFEPVSPLLPGFQSKAAKRSVTTCWRIAMASIWTAFRSKSSLVLGDRHCFQLEGLYLVLRWIQPAVDAEEGEAPCCYSGLGLRVRADDLVVDKTYVRIFVWDISDGVSNPLLMFEAERIFEEQIKDEENGRRKQYATPRTLVRSSLLPHTQECGNTCWNSSGLVPQCHRIAPSRKQ
ncbi:hypothetical protein I315_05814, partial [Cryptococcus gattii Ru294]